MSVVIDLNVICLICLQDGELISVFERDNDTQMKISEKIMKCCDLSICADSKMPDKICTKCLQELATTYNFLQNCETAMAVFRTIQQQEDALATYELEQQKIKIPSGLKIKRIKPEGTTCLMSMPVEQMQKPGQISSKNETPIPSQDAEEELDSEDEEKEEEVLEEVELDDYYETEEIMEDNREDNMTEISVEEPGAIVKTLGKTSPQKKEQNTSPDALRMALTKVVVKGEGVVVAEENKPPAQQSVPKRGRGRPRKVKGPLVKLSFSSRPNKDASISSSNTKSSVLKAIAVRKPHKLNKLATDAKPTKICDVCGNSYKYQHALNAHMRRHNNDRPFNCEFCEKAFVSAVELRRHMRVHTGHKPYPCKYCDRRFSDFGSRIKHERTHTGERPYNCTTCGKAFAYAHVLSVHIRTHTGEKKFRCNLCGKGFTKKAYLKTHTEQHVRFAALEQCADVVEDRKSNRQLLALKEESLEECIFTAEYIDDDSASATSVVQMNEDHLDLNEHGMQPNCKEETITGDFSRLAYVKPVKSDDDSSYQEET